MTDQATMTAEEIRDAIDILGVSQGGLADLLGMSARTIRRYCAGKKIPHLVAEKVRALVFEKVDALVAAHPGERP